MRLSINFVQVVGISWFRVYKEMRKFIYTTLYLGLSLVLADEILAATPKTPTHDDAIIVVEQRVALIVAKDVMRVVEVFILENKTDATLVGSEGRGSLHFVLPEGFFAPQFIEDPADTISITDRGFEYIKPVDPGELQLAVSYHLKVSSFPYTFSIQTSYPTQSLNIFTDRSMEVVSDQLRSQPLVQMGEQQLRRYAGGNFDKDTRVILKLIPANEATQSNSGIPTSDASRIVPLPPEEQQDNQRQGLIVSILVSILIIGGVLSIYAKSQLKKTKKASKSSTALKPSLKQEREELIKIIAELDDQFEAGAITEETYRKERARRKKKLIELTRILNQKLETRD